MADITRRMALGACAATVAGFSAPKASASVPASLATHPGFRAWTPPARVGSLPLQDLVQTEAGPKRLVDWLDHRPAVLALWATWCAPCLLEKPNQAAMAHRLAIAGASTRILALQIFDEGVALPRARAILDHIDARGLPLAQAMPTAEQDFQHLFAGQGRHRTDTVLPVVLLIDGAGLEMGRAVGAMTGVDGQTDYWRDDATFDFLSRLL